MREVGHLLTTAAGQRAPIASISSDLTADIKHLIYCVTAKALDFGWVLTVGRSHPLTKHDLPPLRQERIFIDQVNTSSVENFKPALFAAAQLYKNPSFSISFAILLPED